MKNNLFITIIVVLLCLIVGFGVGMYFQKDFSSNVSNSNTNDNSTNESTNTTNDSDDNDKVYITDFSSLPSESDSSVNILKDPSNLIKESFSEANAIIKNDKYYIIETYYDGIAGFGFTIFDNNGNEVLKENNATYYKYNHVVKNSVYYYNSYKENEDGNYTLYYNYIDLSKDNLEVVEIKNEIVTDIPQA
jgi:hypothetical protein